jgi:hypothetical protein
MDRVADTSEGSRTGDPGGLRITAMIDELEAAKRDLAIAERARVDRADEVARIAKTVESSLGSAIDDARSERDHLKQRLHDAEQRLEELESARSKARIEGFATATPPADPTSVEASRVPTPEAVSPNGRDADISGQTKSDESAVYEDGWYEVLKRQQSVDGDEQ